MYDLILPTDSLVKKNIPLSLSLFLYIYIYIYIVVFMRSHKIAKSDYLLPRQSVSPSVHMEQLGSHLTDFHEI